MAIYVYLKDCDFMGAYTNLAAAVNQAWEDFTREHSWSGYYEDSETEEDAFELFRDDVFGGFYESMYEVICTELRD